MFRPLCFVIIASAILIAPVAPIDILRGSYVTWKEEHINVLKPKMEFEIKLFLTDPCPIIHANFPTFWSSDYAQLDLVKHSYNDCSNRYKLNVIDPLQDLVRRFTVRIRRARSPMLGLMAGVWLSNVIDSYFNENDEIAYHEEKQNEALNQLNRRQNYTDDIVIKLAQEHKFLLDKVNQLKKETDESTRSLFRLNFALSLATTKMTTKKSAIDMIRFDLVNSKKLNLQAMNILLDTQVFENIDSKTIEFIDVDRQGHNGYVFRFFGHVIDNDMRVYNVKSLDHWVNVTHTPATLVRYSGPPHVLVNISASCVAGIYDLEPSSISQGCPTKDGRTYDLDSWSPVKTGNPFVDLAKTSYIENLPKVNVYCLGRKISIDDDAAFDCPPYAMVLPSQYKWTTSDYIFRGYPLSIINHTDHLPENISPSNIQDGKEKKFVESDALREIFNLTMELEKERNKLYVLDTPIGGVPASIWSKILLSTVLFTIIFMASHWFHSHRNMMKHHENIIRSIKLHIDKILHPKMYPELPSVDDIEAPTAPARPIPLPYV